ncbi:LOW QUALITY PROTEIN: protein cortex-like [Ceratina calcarata]|uniref:LOW QUALITY PROTEIN: protein cortex-like n=1 Tax=Ceratina calcarata TaxID=156304 RepID=A0AAJ7S273_9HYME|nr:LOW QUALITY PROTEIN: protein cortex-like [Ceratina calcarata]
MRRRLLLDENRSEDIDVTPQRRSLVRLPRLRLLDKHVESVRTFHLFLYTRPFDLGIVKRGNVSRVRDSCFPSTVNKADPGFASEPRRYAIPQDVCTGDRFIRSKFNADASHYLLTRKAETVLKENTLDVLEQVKALSTNWRKKSMHQLMEEGNVIPGLGQRKVLGSLYRSNNKSVKKLSGTLAARPKELWKYENDPENGMWWSKPRAKPLIGSIDSILDVPGFRSASLSNLLLFTGTIKMSTNSICYYFRQGPDDGLGLERCDIGRVRRHRHVLRYSCLLLGPDLSNVDIGNVHALKWKQAGSMLAICTSSDVKLYCCETKKMIWSTKCEQAIQTDLPCYDHCVCWSENDRQLLVGCNGMITSYDGKTGKPTNSCETDKEEVLSLAFSCNYKYIAAQNQSLKGCNGMITSYDGKTGKPTNSCETDKEEVLSLAFSCNYKYIAALCADGAVRIFFWPSLMIHLYIFYYEYISAMAWHPREGGRLCVGFGGCLGLWNVNESTLGATYRKVSFKGTIVNLAWNSLTGELVVHWHYRKERGGDWCTVMPVLASLDRIVDVLPVEQESRVYSIMWSPDYSQLAVQLGEPTSIWNFFGNEYPCRHKEKKKKDENRREARDNMKNANFKDFRFFNIR